MEREDAVVVLNALRHKLLHEAATAAEALAILADAGKAVGYTPAMRCLVYGQDAEQAIRWGR